jgi:sugar lactone lactonase YvrE
VTTGTHRTAAALAALLAAGAARAQTFALKPEVAVYQDAKEAPLRAPEGVACREDGAVVVADTGNGRLLRLTWKDGVLSTATELKIAQVTAPADVQLDASGAGFLVLDRKEKRIARVDGAGAHAGWLDPKGLTKGSVVPAGFAAGSDGTVAILDAAGGVVLVLDADGTVRRKLPLPREGGAVFTAVALGATGTVYVVDAVAARVWSAPKDAQVLKPFTEPLKGYMNFPGHLVATPRGLVVVDQNGSGLVLIGQDGSYLGRQLSMGWSAGFVYYPSQICVTAAGDVFVADRGNHRVQVFTAAR